MSNIKFTIDRISKSFLKATHIYILPVTSRHIQDKYTMNSKKYHVQDRNEFGDSEMSEFEEPDDLREFFVD